MSETKKHSEYARELFRLTPSDIYCGLLGHGLFPEKLPPIFTSEDFSSKCEQNIFDSCKKEGVFGYYKRGRFFVPCGEDYITYESIRNTNVPRIMGIPSPFAYYNLCFKIKEYWEHIQNHFSKKTEGDERKISLIHIRKIKGRPCVFEMNYKSPHRAVHPELEIRVGAKYLVRADISNCFPSMYSHALAWALAGKNEAKAMKNEKNLWYNKLDSYARKIKNNETNGFLIGPHASNLLSEIILVSIDKELKAALAEAKQGGDYFRNIDDYSFYAKNYDDAQQFLIYLGKSLREYGLTLNHKKTEIIELPQMFPEPWVAEIKDFLAACPLKHLGGGRLEAFINKVISLFKSNGKNSAIINYALKSIRDWGYDSRGREYCIKTIFHLTLLYPYIFPLLGTHLFDPFDVEVGEIRDLTEKMFKESLSKRNYEAASYSIYYALRYNFPLIDVKFEEIRNTGDCILLVLAWKYAKRFGPNKLEKKYVEHAEELQKNDFGRYWIFVYEVLKEDKFENSWKILKKENVSFLRKDEDVRVKVSPNNETIPFDENYDYPDPEIDVLSTEIIEKAKKEVVEFGDKEFCEQLNLLLRNLFLGFVCERNVSISRRRFRDAEGSIGKINFPSKFLKLLDWLRDRNYVGERLGHGKKEGMFSRPSCYWPKEKLYSRFKKFSREFCPRNRLDDVVVLKDRQGRPRTVLFATPKEYCSILKYVNELYSKFKFDYKPKLLDERVMFAPQLRAIFNRDSWECGGRLYSTGIGGICYQNLPSETRKTIRIGGKETVELDFSGMHITMLYAKKNIAPPENVYTFASEELKPLVKHLLLVLINSRDEVAALNEINFHAKKLEECWENSSGNIELLQSIQAMKEQGKSFEGLIEEIKNHHNQIREFFGTDCGVRLQNKDSKIALEIIREFAEKGIPVLPIHDSFIIEKEHKDELKETMTRAFATHNKGHVCEIY